MRMRFLVVGVMAVQTSCARVSSPAAAPSSPPVGSSVPRAPAAPDAAAVAPPPRPAPSPPAQGTATPAESPPAAPPPLPAPLIEALAAAEKAIAANDWAAADARIAAATAAAGSDAHLDYLVARTRATRFAYSGDFERAAAAFLAAMPALTHHPELPDEFWAHNAMMMIREAQGDPAAALAENDQASLSAARGTWNPEDRDTLAFQKDRWHRAYLTRMLSESRAGTVKQALVEYAQAALDDYRTRGYPESVAVLEAYFAALDGNRAAALAAARQVDPAKDDDIEDLYLVVVGLEAGGDHAGAEAVRRVMRRPGRVHLARAIMLRWLGLDARPGAHGFTPLHASGR